MMGADAKDCSEHSSHSPDALVCPAGHIRQVRPSKATAVDRQPMKS